NRAIARIKAITTKPEIGEVYEGVVKNIQPFGAFVEFLPGTDGLLHISEICEKRLNTVEEMLHEGDKIKVKLLSIDPKTGKYKLSHKALTETGERPEKPARQSHGHQRNGRRGPRKESNNK
ncbi:MAG: S1 RNA-binding domain-containing protein, partial [Bacteroidales bacterium]|nr:S1 RNA-binding domain-containing protein [Bacteroidales bacterium]